MEYYFDQNFLKFRMQFLGIFVCNGTIEEYFVILFGKMHRKNLIFFLNYTIFVSLKKFLSALIITQSF